MSHHRGNDRPDIDEETAAVLERAQRMIAERRLAAATHAASRQRPWQVACIVLPLVLVTATLVWPGGTLVDRLRAVVRGICDQRNNLASYGMALPPDARCTGIYSGLLAALICLALLDRLRATCFPRRAVMASGLLAILFVAVDGVNSFLTEAGITSLYAPHNALRLASGISSGVALVVLGMPLFNGIVRTANRDQHDSTTLVETLGIVAVATLLGVLLWFGGPTWLFPLLAMFSVLGSFVALALIHLLVLTLFMGIQRQVVLTAQLARPAVLSMTFVILEFALLATLRGA